MAATKTKPKGRKSDKPLRDALSVAIHREVKDPVSGKKVKRLFIIADRLASRACKDTVAAREVWDRIEGKPAQTLNVRRIAGWEDLEDDELLALSRGGRGEE